MTKMPTVLIVEDHPETMQLYRDALRNSVCIVAARTESDALAYLKGVHFDLVVLDLRLSQGSGQSILRYIRAQPTHEYTPVLVVTADTRSAVPEADKVLRKPFSIDDLWQTMDKLLAVPPKQPGSTRWQNWPVNDTP